jgi:hypothetical protein
MQAPLSLDIRVTSPVSWSLAALTGMLGLVQEVRGVAADSGAWNTIYPILLAAMHDGAATCVHLSGASARRYRAGGLTGLPPALRVELDPLETDSAPSSLPGKI